MGTVYLVASVSVLLGSGHCGLLMATFHSHRNAS